MSGKFRESYRFDGGLEQAVIDLVRIGSTGSASGVRQLASRLVRTVPPEVDDPAAFSAALHEALSAVVKQPGLLRFAGVSLPVEAGTDLTLVTVDECPDGDGLVLESQTSRELSEVTEERRRADELVPMGIRLTRTLLLSGPPGVGKTMTARWLASEIGVPLVGIDLSALVSSFLGTTGRNLRSVFDFAASRPCVFLLDEFDALAKRRDDDTDVGELKRIVNVLLAELDRWPESNLLVAATNHPHLLDLAVGRRFDRIINLSPPGTSERRTILCHLAGAAGLEVDTLIGVIADVTVGMTGADLVAVWNTARRRAVLRNEDLMLVLCKEVAQRAQRPAAEGDHLWQALADRLGLSDRQISAFAGVSHPEVSAALKRTRSTCE